MSPEAQWSRGLFDRMREGAVWGVPRSGMIFTRRGETLVLTDQMPHMPGMPITPEQLLEQQESDFDAVRKHFGDAGIQVVREM